MGLHGWWTLGASDGLADGHGAGEGAVWRVEASLDEVLAFGLGHERLEFGGSEGVDEAGFGDDEEEDLGAC